MTLLEKIQKFGFKDFQSLSYTIRHSGLGATDLGYIYTSSIKLWLQHSFGMNEVEAKQLYDALIGMGYLRENSYGNVYPV